MQYLLLLYVDEAGWPRLSPAEQERGVAAYAAFSEALASAGALVASHRLQPSATARTLRGGDGRPAVTDGPFAETKEQLGGYFLIEAPDLEAALDWAARCPAAGHGAVEVRPLWSG